MAKLVDVKVYSPIVDDNIKNNLDNSFIWGKCYHEDEKEEAMSNNTLTCYTIKFNGSKAVQVTKIERLK